MTDFLLGFQTNPAVSTVSSSEAEVLGHCWGAKGNTGTGRTLVWHLGFLYGSWIKGALGRGLSLPGPCERGRKPEEMT